MNTVTCNVCERPKLENLEIEYSQDFCRCNGTNQSQTVEVVETSESEVVTLPQDATDESVLQSVSQIEIPASETESANVVNVVSDNPSQQLGNRSDPWLNEVVFLKDGSAGVVLKYESGWYYIKSKTDGAITKSRLFRLKKYSETKNFSQLTNKKQSSTSASITNSTATTTTTSTAVHKPKLPNSTTGGRKRKTESTIIPSKFIEKSSRHSSSANNGNISGTTSSSALDSKSVTFSSQITNNTTINDFSHQNIQQNNPMIAPSVLLSTRDKSHGLVLNSDQLSCYGIEVNKCWSSVVRMCM